MLSDRDRRSLSDILWNIDLALSFVDGLDEESFAAVITQGFQTGADQGDRVGGDV